MNPNNKRLFCRKRQNKKSRIDAANSSNPGSKTLCITPRFTPDRFQQEKKRKHQENCQWKNNVPVPDDAGKQEPDKRESRNGKGVW